MDLILNIYDIKDRSNEMRLENTKLWDSAVKTGGAVGQGPHKIIKYIISDVDRQATSARTLFHFTNNPPSRQP